MVLWSLRMMRTCTGTKSMQPSGSYGRRRRTTAYSSAAIGSTLYKCLVDLVQPAQQTTSGTTHGGSCAEPGCERPWGDEQPVRPHHGRVQTHCPLMVSLQADVYARQCLRQHRSGNIIMAAWHRLGYIDVEELAKRKLGGDLDQLDAALSHVPHSMATLLNLDALPDLGLVAAAEELDNSKVLDALIGCKHVWWFHDEEDLCRPLPDWLNKGFTPSQQKRFDTWTTQSSRTIWVQPTRCTATLQGGKDGGKLLTIHLSRDPNELFVQLGQGRKPLFVRQYLRGKSGRKRWTCRKACCRMHPVTSCRQRWRRNQLSSMVRRSSWRVMRLLPASSPRLRGTASG